MSGKRREYKCAVARQIVCRELYLPTAGGIAALIEGWIRVSGCSKSIVKMELSAPKLRSDTNNQFILKKEIASFHCLRFSCYANRLYRIMFFEGYLNTRKFESQNS